MSQYEDSQLEIDYFDILLKALFVGVFASIIVFAVDSVPWVRAIVIGRRVVNYAAVFCIFFLIVALSRYGAEWSIIHEVRKHQGRGE